MRPEILTAEIRAELAKVMNGYRPRDQTVWLGEPPWQDSESLQAWENAHGHDPRLKCYPEFGCLVEWKDALFPHVKLAVFILARHAPVKYGLVEEWYCRVCTTFTYKAAVDWPCPDITALARAWEVSV